MQEFLNRLPFPIKFGAKEEPEFGSSLISQRLYNQYGELVKTDDAAMKAEQEARDISYQAEANYYSSRKPGDPIDGSAYEEMEAKKKETSLKWHQSLNTQRDLDAGMRDISIDLIKRRWPDLSVPERRVVDVESSKHQLSSKLIRRVIDGLISGSRIEDESTFVRNNGEIKDLKVNSLGYYLYGGQNRMDKKHFKPDAAHIFGSGIFGLQRIASFFVPEMLSTALEGIPEENTINREAVRSYLVNLITQCRARILSQDGLRLTLEPHITQPYTDTEWTNELEKQLEAAPLIAATLVEECPNLLAVTMYGAITRKNRKFVMFHPNDGLKMGACFMEKDRAEASKAMGLAHELGEKYGVQVQTGTGQGGVFGGAFYTWEWSTEQDILQRMRELDSQRTTNFGETYENYISHITIDQMHELMFQLLQGDPLAVRNQAKFNRIRNHLERFKTTYSDPIFSRVRFLYEHFEKGYPTPVEYSGPYKS